jgi:4-hydroxy-tetrahydrodipicolinate reductase
MGRAVLEAAGEDERFRVAAAMDVDPPDNDLPGKPAFFTRVEDALASVSPGVVAVDISSPRDAVQRIRTIAGANCPLVEGTTALGGDAERALAEAADRIAVVVAPNLSPGIALLRRALRAVLTAEGVDWDIGVLDRHHRMKKDAPSGTARLLEESIRSAAKTDDARIEVASFRQGGVVGEHSVHLSGPEEELVLAHRAFSRGVFARGALLAAAFAATATPGSYSIDDVLELSLFRATGAPGEKPVPEKGWE